MDGTGEEDNESEKTIDVAMDYIKRLERELKAKNSEHKFLKSRLDKALEKKAHPSMASWQNSENGFGEGHGATADYFDRMDHMSS